MSISDLSNTLQKKILNQIVKNARADLKTASAIPADTNNPFYRPSTINSAVRDITNQNQISVITKAGIAALTGTFDKLNLEMVKSTGRVLFKSGKYTRSSKYKELVKVLRKAKTPDNQEKIIQNLSSQISAVLSNPSFWDNILDTFEKQKLIDDTNEGLIKLKASKHGQALDIFRDLVAQTSANRNKQLVKEVLQATLDTGHLIGIFNQKLIRLLAVNATVEYNSEFIGDLAAKIIDEESYTGEERNKIERLNVTYSKALGLLEQMDYLSSLLVENPEIFVEVAKIVYGNNQELFATSEIQFSAANSAIGRLLAVAGKNLSNLLKKAGADLKQDNNSSSNQDTDPQSIDFADRLEKLFQNIGAIGDAVSKAATDIEAKALSEASKKQIEYIRNNANNFAQILIESKGSDSILKSIAVQVSNAITGTKNPAKEISKASAKSSPKKKIANSSPKNIKKLNTPKKVRKPNIKIPSMKAAITKGLLVGQDLLKLQNLINSMLTQRVKDNMGSGNRRDILNLRSGRFAESVKVERMSESRQGMITAFYTYMKNPYATFSEGGRQEFPRSRDPKLLISKSIRDIAAQQVANKLRAVSL